MNVYEEAHRLRTAIEESEEFKQYDSYKKQLEKNPELDRRVNEFLDKQMKIQAKQFTATTEEERQEAMKEMTLAAGELSTLMVTDPLVGQYMQAQMRFSIMMADVYKILADLIGIGNIM